MKTKEELSNEDKSIINLIDFADNPINTDEDKECYSVDFLWTFDDDEVDYYRYTYHGYTYQGKKITKIEWMYISIR